MDAGELTMATASSSSHSSYPETPCSPRHVVIVGGGMAGLTAARALLRESTKDRSIRITLLEASDRLGGRIRGDTEFVPGHVLDLGAEFIHGNGTLLTEFIEEHANQWKGRIPQSASLFQDIFITAYADGGPSPEPTPEGFYGMYYVKNELMRYDDERLVPLHGALETMEEQLDNKTAAQDTSIGAVLDSTLPSPELSSLAVAGYANTAGCSNLHGISLRMTVAFEKYWEDNEIDGDYRIHSQIGMMGLVEVLSEELTNHDDAFEARLNWTVCDIRQDQDCDKVSLRSTDGDALDGDVVIVTVPPPLLPHLGLPLSEAKLDALSYIGFDTALKIVLKFSTRLWPYHLQSVVCADLLIPELWFRHFSAIDDQHDDLHVAVCFITSTIAEEFLQLATGTNGKVSRGKVTELVVKQLSELFQLDPSQCMSSHIGTMWYSFGDHPTIRGGYVYPKVGMDRDHLNALAAPQGNVFFAGEATNINACCTVQAAIETGMRAAKEVRNHLGHDTPVAMP